MRDQPDDIFVPYLLAFGHTVVGNYGDALRILSQTGQPDTLINDTLRHAADFEAYATFVNATYAYGDLETARQLAERMFDPDMDVSLDWWYTYLESCALAVLGREDEAIEVFSELEYSPQIPWEPYLRDAVCMRLLDDRPEYEQILEHIESRKHELREKLPMTLRQFGVSL